MKRHWVFLSWIGLGVLLEYLALKYKLFPPLCHTLHWLGIGPPEIAAGAAWLEVHLGDNDGKSNNAC